METQKTIAVKSSLSVFDKAVGTIFAAIMVSLLVWMASSVYDNSLKMATIQVQVDAVLSDNDLEAAMEDIKENMADIKRLEEYHLAR